MEYKKNYPFAEILFILFLILYIGVLVADAKFGPLDDYNFFGTIQAGKFLPLSTFASLRGRFYPLNGWEYNWVTRILPAQPVSYYIFNAAELLLFVTGFYGLLKRITANRAVIFITITLVLTTNNFFHAFFRLLVPERGSVFWFTMFLWAYFSFVEDKKWWSFGLSLIAANFALYYKEPGFLMLGTFALSHLLLSWKQAPRSVKLLDGLLLISSGVFLIAYFLVVKQQPAGSNYAAMLGAKAFLEVLQYNTSYDPILTLCLVPALLLRSFQLIVERKTFHAIYDAMFCGALVYVASFFYLAIHSFWYFVPTYVFSIPALFYYVSQLKNGKYPSFAVAAVVIVLTGVFYRTFVMPLDVFAFIFPNTLPHLNRLRLVPINYDTTLDFLVADIRKNHKGKRANIFLNANRNGGYEAYSSLSFYLRYRGLNTDQFDLLSDTVPNKVYNLSTVEPKSPYSVFHNPEASQIQSGDYLIILPTAFYGSVSELRTDAFGNTSPGACSLTTTKDYDLVFHTETPWAFPWNAWDVEGLKNFVLGHSKQSRTYCDVDLNYYVLVRR
jgi:hypothetical protein